MLDLLAKPLTYINLLSNRLGIEPKLMYGILISIIWENRGRSIIVKTALIVLSWRYRTGKICLRMVPRTRSVCLIK